MGYTETAGGESPSTRQDRDEFVKRFRKMPPGLAAAYAPPSAGPFHCKNCEYQKSLDCFKPEVIREFIMLGNASKGAKTVRVEADGCCAYQEKA